jgi:hypothetical protein
VPTSTRGIVAIGVVLLQTSLACSRSPTAPSPAPSQPSPFATLAKGYYALEVEIDEGCTGFPIALRRRRYDAVIEDPGWHFLLVRVLGDGFRMSPVIGELWVRDESRGFRWPTRLRWNEFEGESYPETLTDARQLYVSGNGEMTIAESTISGAIVGIAAVRGSGPEIRCSGSHRFTFIRPSP